MNATTVENASEVATRLLAQADLVLLAASLLHPPPQALPASNELEALLAAAEAGKSLSAAARQLTIAASQTDPSSWADEHNRLFEGATVCPPNESAYVRRDKGAILADVSGFYQAFGFTASGTAGEKPDHVCCELEFVAALLVMQSCAIETGDADHYETTRGALASFAREHPGHWLGSFIARLAYLTSLPLHAAAASLLDAIWQTLARHHGWGITPQPPVEPRTDDGTPYECGMAEAPSRAELTIAGRPVSG